MENINTEILRKFGAFFVTENNFECSFTEVCFTPTMLQTSFYTDDFRYLEDKLKPRENMQENKQMVCRSKSNDFL